MADVSEIITLGIGTPSTIPFFLTLGLGLTAATGAGPFFGFGTRVLDANFSRPAIDTYQRKVIE